MVLRAVLAVSIATTAVAGAGAVVASAPETAADDAEALAESAFEKWLTSQGWAPAPGTLACAVDTLAAPTVYCYAVNGGAVIAATAALPEPGGGWQFTLFAGAPTPPTGQPGATVVEAPEPTVVAHTAPRPTSSPTSVPVAQIPTTTVKPDMFPGDPTTTIGAATATFGEGLQVVGTDVAPGRYAARSVDFCYWERLSATSNDIEHVIANAIVTGGPVVADILPGDVAFSSSGCGSWTPYVAPPVPATSFGDGVYVVGSDIVPGTYEAEGGEDCYWRRMSDFSANFDALLAIENMTVPGSITIEPTDAGVDTGGCGTWTLVAG
jgi:hypothetical protein